MTPEMITAVTAAIGAIGALLVAIRTLVESIRNTNITKEIHQATVSTASLYPPPEGEIPDDIR